MNKIVHVNFKKDDFCESYVNVMVDALRKRYRLKQDTLIRNHPDHNQLVQLLEALPQFCAEMLHDAYQNGCKEKNQHARDEFLDFFMKRFKANVNKLEWHI
jgi:hypothetical protein